MKNQKNRIIIALLCAIAIFVVSCKEQILDESKDRPRQSVQEESFAFSRTVRLIDPSGKYFTNIVVSSNSEQAIDEYVSMKPSIRVFKSDNTNLSDETQSPLLTGELPEESKVDNSTTISTKFIDGNIPTGYSMEYFFAQKAKVSFSPNSRVSESYDYYPFENGLAKSVKTIVNGPYQIRIGYFSRGCCWYSSGWYNRGYITHYGPNYSYNFVGNPTYSPYLGVKFAYTTTLAAATSTTWQWGY